MISVRFFYYLCVENQLAALKNGADVEIIFEQEICLEENLDEEILKIFLKTIGRNDLVTTLEVYLAIGEYFNITVSS